MIDPDDRLDQADQLRKERREQPAERVTPADENRTPRERWGTCCPHDPECEHSYLDGPDLARWLDTPITDGMALSCTTDDLLDFQPLVTEALMDDEDWRASCPEGDCGRCESCHGRAMEDQSIRDEEKADRG